jgi:hypothetical protein
VESVSFLFLDSSADVCIHTWHMTHRLYHWSNYNLNSAAEMQAIDRTHHLGQYRPIRAIRFLAGRTVEERELQLQEKTDWGLMVPSGGMCTTAVMTMPRRSAC